MLCKRTPDDGDKRGHLLRVIWVTECTNAGIPMPIGRKIYTEPLREKQMDHGKNTGLRESCGSIIEGFWRRIAMAIASTTIALSVPVQAQPAVDAPAVDAAQIQQIQTQVKSLTTAQINNARQFFSAAFAAYQARRLDEAALLFEKGLAINPGEADAQYFYAQVLRDSNKKQDAAKTFSLAAALAPDTVNGTLAAVEARKLMPPKIGQSFRDCPTCPEMSVLPAGTFTMGAPESERAPYKAAVSQGEFFDWSRPQQQVTIASFAVGTYEVTFDEYDACAAEGQCPSPNDGGWGRGKLPVINVSFDDAVRYAVWLSKKTGQKYRLPSEAEWEYAARAGCDRAFSVNRQCKDIISADEANYDGSQTYNGSPVGAKRGRTVSVGSLNAPNAWGIRDMHGNVWEWVEDCWIESLAGMPGNGAARVSGCKEANWRVLRGGSWMDYPAVLRVAVRFRGPADYCNTSIGFRVARTVSA